MRPSADTATPAKTNEAALNHRLSSSWAGHEVDGVPQRSGLSLGAKPWGATSWFWVPTAGVFGLEPPSRIEFCLGVWGGWAGAGYWGKALLFVPGETGGTGGDCCGG